jgi:hypothetical protein
MGSGQPVVIKSPIDPEGGLTVIDYPHHEIHEGNMFFASYKSPDASPIADDGTLFLQLTTGALRTGHLSFAVSSGGDCEVELLEVGGTSVGTPIQSHNMNRQSDNTPEGAVVVNPTIADDGIQLMNFLVPGGSGGNAGGGSMRLGTEWNLKLNQEYALRVTNRAGTTQQVSAALQWYEEQ